MIQAVKNAEAILGKMACSGNKINLFQSHDSENLCFSQSHSTLENNCLQHMSNHGIRLDGPIVSDGKIRRFSMDSNKKNKDEWYIARSWEFKGKLYLACSFGSWSISDAKYRYKSWEDGELSGLSINERKEIDAYLKKMEEECERERKIRHDEVAKDAERIWDSASETPPDDTYDAYLRLKGIKSHGSRFCKNPNGYPSMIRRIRNPKGKIRSIQFISVGKDGKVYKTFLEGGEKKGNFDIIGDIKKSDRYLVAESFSTGASIYESKGIPVVIALDAGNIDPALASAKESFPKHKYDICGDDDTQAILDKQLLDLPLDGKENKGRKCAEAAADKYNCKAFFPKFPDDFKLPNGKLGSDFNDLHVHFGKEQVQEQIEDEWYKKTPTPFGEIPLKINLSVLPKEFQRAVLEEYRFIKSPIETLASIGMTVINTAIGKSATIQELPGLEHYPCQGYINILNQGERKSQSFKDMGKALEDFVKSRTADWERKVKKTKAKNAVIETQIRSITSKSKDGENIEEILEKVSSLESKKTSLPPSPKICSTDVTEQRLFELMKERNGEFAVLAGEGRPIVNNIMGISGKNGEANDSIYLAGLSGDKITRDRIGANNERIEMTIDDPCLNLGTMIQPDKWTQLANHPKLQESGFLARLFVIYPSSTVGNRLLKENEHRGLKKDEVAPFHQKIRTILEQKESNYGTGLTHKVFIHGEAAKARDALHNEMEICCRPGRKYSINGLTQGIASKFTSQVCKIALALHIFKQPDLLREEESFLSIDTWKEAQELGLFFLNETLRALRHALTSKSKQAQTVEEKLIFWLYDRYKEGKPLSSREIQQYFRPRKKKLEIEALLKKLEEHHCARFVGNNNSAIELHPYNLENGVDWLRGTDVKEDADD